MILFDGIIYSLQTTGGISVLFNEIIARLRAEEYVLLGFSQTPPFNKSINSYYYMHPRILERYRRVKIDIKYELFHSTYYRLPKVNSGKKIVTTVHDFTYERHSSGYRQKIHSIQKNKAIEHSDKIICVSENTRQDLLNIMGGSYEERTVVVYNGVSDKYKNIPNIEFDQQIIFVGLRGGYKNYISVVKALSYFNDISLVCIGGGQFTANEIKLMEKYIPGRYCHAGYLTTEELNHEYNKSLCLIYPSLYEGFGIPILESMRAGCPVVAVNKSSVPEIAGNAVLLMETGSPDEIYNAIEQVNNPSIRKIMVANGFIQSRHFTWDKTFANTVDVYNSLLGKNMTTNI